MKYKTSMQATKADMDGGSVTGYASTFDREPDSYGDVVAPGAFSKTLERWKELGKPIPLLYGHKTDDPAYNIGHVTAAEEDGRGLLVTAEFDPDNEKAQYVRKLVREGRLFQFSFAYDVKDFGTIDLEDGRKANELRELEIYEVSLVQIPANQHAEVIEVKEAPLDVKAGRRNSKADADALETIRGLAAEIGGIVAGLLADEQEGTVPEGGEEEPEPAETNGDDEGKGDPKGGDGAKVPEGREGSAELLEIYKQAIKETYR